MEQKSPPAGCAEGCGLALGILVSALLFLLFPPAGLGAGFFIALVIVLYLVHRQGKTAASSSRPSP